MASIRDSGILSLFFDFVDTFSGCVVFSDMSPARESVRKSSVERQSALIANNVATRSAADCSVVLPPLIFICPAATAATIIRQFQWPVKNCCRNSGHGTVNEIVRHHDDPHVLGKFLRGRIVLVPSWNDDKTLDDVAALCVLCVLCHGWSVSHSLRSLALGWQSR